jgi:hypothetical protein
MRVTNFLQTSSQSKVFTQNHGSPKLQKLQKSQLWEFWNSHLGVPRQNDIWVLVSWPGTEYTIRGKVMASPKSGLWWVLWVHGCSWLVRAPKCSNYDLTNLYLGLCRSMWVIELLVNLPSPHPRAPTCPSTPKMLRAKEHTATPSPFVVFTFGLETKSTKEFRGVSLDILKGFNILNNCSKNFI